MDRAGQAAAVTVVCVLVKGEVAYTPEYVRRLLVMVRRWIDRPFRFVCLTDQPEAMPPGVEPIAIERFVPCWALWSKLHMFDPRHGFSGRMLYLDLDTLIVGPLAPIIDVPAALALCADELAIHRVHLDRDRHGRQIRRRFNSSVIVWNGGEHTDLFTRFTLGDTTRLSTDQDLIAERKPDAMAMNAEWFPRLSLVQPPWPEDAKVVLCKKPKNGDAMKRWPWFDAEWGGWE